FCRFSGPCEDQLTRAAPANPNSLTFSILRVQHRRQAMIIGKFHKMDDGSYSGEIHTLTTSNVAVKIVPVARESANQPNFRIWSTFLFKEYEVGAAWTKTGVNGDFLSVVLDGPELGAPLHALLV